MSKLSRRSFLKHRSQRTGCRCSGHDRLQQQHCRKQHRILCRCFCTRFRHPGSAARCCRDRQAQLLHRPVSVQGYRCRAGRDHGGGRRGCGNAGCTAACSCVENGSEVVVIEAQNAIHGQGGGVGLCNTKYVQSLVDEGKLPHMTDVVEHQNIWVQRCGSRVNEALVSMWFNNSPEAGNWLIDKCAEFGVVPVSFRAHAPNAIIPESYDYHMFVNVGDHQFDSKCGYFAATNVLYEDSQNAEKYEHPATYFFNTKAQELLVEDGRVTGVFAQRDGELWLFRATKGVILPPAASTRIPR